MRLLFLTWSQDPELKLYYCPDSSQNLGSLRLRLQFFRTVKIKSYLGLCAFNFYHSESALYKFFIEQRLEDLARF
jgi:hypothetical protein